VQDAAEGGEEERVNLISRIQGCAEPQEFSEGLWMEGEANLGWQSAKLSLERGTIASRVLNRGPTPPQFAETASEGYQRRHVHLRASKEARQRV
jgi:hypothetical protein